MRYSILCISLMLFTGFFSGCSKHKINQEFKINQGILVIPPTNLGEEIIPLDGQWEFYPEKFIQPGDFTEEKTYFKVPGFWNDETVNGKKLKAHSHASYRLIIEGLRPGHYGIHVIDMESSYNLYVNGDLIGKNGKPGLSESETIPEWKPDLYIFSVKDSENSTEVILHVSNFHHRLGGIWDSLSLGSYEFMNHDRTERVIMEVFFAGAIFISVLFHFQLFLFRRNELAYLYFSIAWFFLAFRISVTGERIMMIFFQIPWEFLVKFDYLTAILANLFMHSFLYSSNPGEYVKKIYLIIISIFTIFAAIVILFTVNVFTHILIPLNAFMLAAGLYWIYASFRSWRSGAEGFNAIFIGAFVHILTGINDILYNLSIIQTGNYMHLGSSFFLISQVYFLSIRYNNAFVRSEKLSFNISKLLGITRKFSEFTSVLQVITNGVDQILLGHSYDKDKIYFYIYEEDARQWRKYKYISSSESREEEVSGYECEAYAEMKNSVSFNESMYFPVLSNNKVQAMIKISGNHKLLDSEDLEYISGITFSLGPVIENLKKQEKSKLEAIGLLASEIIHDIRNHLQIIFATIDAKRKKLEISDEIKKTFDLVQEESSALSHMLQDILDYTKDRIVLNLEKTDLNIYMQSICNDMRQFFEDHNVQLNFETIDRVTVMIDKVRMRRAILNIFKNAVEALAGIDNKMISLRTGSEEDTAYIIIRDNGRGIPEKELLQIFTPFQSKGKINGTGLGLAAVKRIVDGHKGDIMVSSESSGTRFTIKLPVNHE